MSPYREPPADLDARVTSVLDSLAALPTDKSLQRQAAKLAHEIRSRCIDLAIWHADNSPEYKQRKAQVVALLQSAGGYADESICREFGVAPPNNSFKPKPLRGSA